MEIQESIYGAHRPALMDELMRYIGDIRSEMEKKLNMDPVEHCLCRIKSEESMREKCRRNTIRDYLKSSEEYEVITEKAYIRHAKPNGYRSYHMILRTKQGYFAEIQLRTISMDTWAALEHHLKYKKSVGSRAALIEEELKRCADELASTDLSMQTIRDMILEV